MHADQFKGRYEELLGTGDYSHVNVSKGTHDNTRASEMMRLLVRAQL
jgi:hypothetical protein